MEARGVDEPDGADHEELQVGTSETAGRQGAADGADERRPGGTAEPRLYSVEEAAAILGIGRTFMFRLVGTGEIESCKIGKLRKITSTAIHDFIARLAREQSNTSVPEKACDHVHHASQDEQENPRPCRTVAPAQGYVRQVDGGARQARPDRACPGSADQLS
jgi:excisionase family DNA binding protein